MNIFVIKVSSLAPYPITFEYVEKAGSFRTAIGRAVEKFRKEPRLSRKHLDNMSIKVGKGIGIKL